MNFYQGKDLDQKIGFFITKENQPEGMPPYKEGMKQAQFDIYKIERSEFLKGYLLNLATNIQFQNPLPAGEPAPEDFHLDQPGDDEVPF